MSMSICRLSPVPVLSLLGAPAIAGTVVTLRPGPSSDGLTNGDAFVTTGPAGNLAGNNYGGAGAWAVAAAGSSKGPFSSVVRFDVSAAKAVFDAAYGPGGWDAESAALRLTTTMANNPIFNAGVPGQVAVRWIADDSWVEGAGNPNAPSGTGLTWENFTPLLEVSEPAGMLAVLHTGDGVTAEYPLAICPGMRGDMATGGTLGLAFTPGDDSVAVLFNSRSFGTASRNPALVLTAGPFLPEITDLRRSEIPGRFILSFTSRAGLSVIPQSSANLMEWNDSEPVLSVAGRNDAPVSAGAGDAAHFWRLKRVLP